MSSCALDNLVTRLFDLKKKIAKILTAQGAPPESNTPVANGK
jgi:hypothetical protein